MASDKDHTSSPSEGRKSTKPIMEKRRRARINSSLSELKSLLLEVMKREGARHHKMEKADILEMTVKHLRQIQRHQFTAAVTTDPSVFNKYHAGFNECANEVSRYLGSVDGLDVELRARMLNHLANCIQGFNPHGAQSSQSSPINPATSPTRGAVHLQTSTIASSSGPPPVQITPKTPIKEINNNVIPNVQPLLSPTLATPTATVGQPGVLSGVQVIPSKLPSGEIALVIPGNVMTNGQIPSYIIPLYAGTSQTVPSNQVPQGQHCQLPVIAPSPTAGMTVSQPYLGPKVSHSPLSTKTSSHVSQADIAANKNNIKTSSSSASGMRDLRSNVTEAKYNDDNAALDFNAGIIAAQSCKGDSVWRPW